MLVISISKIENGHLFVTASYFTNLFQVLMNHLLAPFHSYHQHSNIKKIDSYYQAPSLSAVKFGSSNTLNILQPYKNTNLKGLFFYHQPIDNFLTNNILPDITTLVNADDYIRSICINVLHILLLAKIKGYYNACLKHQLLAFFTSFNTKFRFLKIFLYI